MNQLRHAVIRAGFGALAMTGAHHLLRPMLAGVGTIFMLHHVRPARRDAFQPNGHLEITPDFLRTVLQHLRDTGTDVVAMDEVPARLHEANPKRRFAAFTFDDGYRDNRDHALPAMREFAAPFTVYVTTDFADGTGRLWWMALERIVAADKVLSPADKQARFARLHDRLRSLPEAELRGEVSALCRAARVDEAAISRELCMDWDELRAFAADPLVTIGAHTLSHCNLAQQPADVAAREIVGSRDCIAQKLQRDVTHFAYPYGDRAAAGQREFAATAQAGFATAVTTRPGMLFADNAAHVTALPRLSLNGHYQDARFLPVLTSGAATALWNGFRRVDAA